MNKEQKIGRIIGLFSEINVFIRKSIYKAAEQYRFTIPQLTIIGVLMMEDGLRISDLSERSSLSESTVSGIVDRLVKQKALTRERSEEDRRVVNIYLAEESKKEYEKFDKMKKEFFSSLFLELPEADLDKIIAGLILMKDCL